MPKRDWIDELNDLAQAAVPPQGDRELIEDMIVWLNATGLGPRFVSWYRDNLVVSGTPIAKLVVR